MTLPRYTGVTVQTATNAPAPAATVTVNLHNTSTPADLFSDEGGATPLANPLTSDAVTGLFTFCVANGLYDLTVTGVALTPYTIPGVQLVYQGAPVGQLLIQPFTLQHADILALPTTPFTLVAAQGPGSILLPIRGLLTTSFVAPYTNINAGAFLSIALGVFPATNVPFNFIPNDASIVAGSPTGFSDLFASTTPKRQDLVPWANTEGVDEWGPLTGANARTTVDNQPLIMAVDNQGNGALTGGDPSNTLSGFIAYLIG